MASILITGGTGLIGTALTNLLLSKGHAVTILTRKVQEVKNKLPGVAYAEWDVETQTIDVIAIAKADHIIHLAGAGVADERWTEKRKAEIKDSRINSGHLLVKALKENANNVQTVVSSSAIGWYGSDDRLTAGKQAFTEDMPADPSFLGETCKLWEESIAPVSAMGKRLILVRTGIVLSNNGGAFPSFKKPVTMGVAAILGSGKQIVSWIHIDDLCHIYLAAIDDKKMTGPYNGVAPAPVSNKALTVDLAHKLKGRFYIPFHVPSFLLKLLLGEMSVEVLKSATVSSKKITDAGFNFRYATLAEALNDLCKKGS